MDGELEIIPLMYAISKGLKAYAEAVKELERIEKNCSMENHELDQIIKRYEELKTIFSLARKFMG